MALLPRRVRRRTRPPRRATALVVAAEAGPTEALTWPSGLVVALGEDLHDVPGPMTRGRWLVPGERIGVLVDDQGCVTVDWTALPPLAVRVGGGDRPFVDPDGATAEILAAVGSGPPPPPFDRTRAALPVPGLPDVLGDGRLRGEARVLAMSRQGTGSRTPDGGREPTKWYVLSVAVPGHVRWGAVAMLPRLDRALLRDGVPVGVHPGRSHAVGVLAETDRDVVGGGRFPHASPPRRERS